MLLGCTLRMAAPVHCVVPGLASPVLSRLADPIYLCFCCPSKMPSVPRRASKLDTQQFWQQQRAATVREVS
jgi:hypothetical protein